MSLFLISFSGTNCEENVDECMSNPCQNGGHCRDRNNGYTCTCQPGYLGDHCEVDVAVCETGKLTNDDFNKFKKKNRKKIFFIMPGNIYRYMQITFP